MHVLPGTASTGTFRGLAITVLTAPGMESGADSARGGSPMNWRQIAMGLGRVMKGAGAAAVVALLALPAGAGDVYYSGSTYADGLTPESTWEQIMKTPRTYLEFPMVNLGKSYVTVGALCAEGEMLRMADQRAGNDVRVPASSVRRPAEAAAASGYRALRADVFSASDVRAPARPEAAQQPPVRYPVSVYRVISGGLTTERVFLFTKPWEVPACGSR
jgi:hypothetical protein